MNQQRQRKAPYTTFFKSNQLHWLTINGTVKRLKPCKKSIIKEAIKDGRGTGTAMQATAWKCLAMGQWQCVQGDCSLIREALRPPSCTRSVLQKNASKKLKLSNVFGEDDITIAIQAIVVGAFPRLGRWNSNDCLLSGNWAFCLTYFTLVCCFKRISKFVLVSPVNV